MDRGEALMRNCLLLLALAACARERGGAPGDANNSTTQATERAAPVGTASTGSNAPKTLLFLGTSITAGYGLDPDEAYPMQIQRKIDSARLAYRVVNAGVSGETSSGLLRRLEWLLQQRLDVVVIETGANDGLRGVPIETMRSNLEQIITRIRSAQPATTIALVQMEAMPNMGRSYAQGFHDAFPALAKRNGVVLLPFLLDGVAGERDLNQGDGIHPNERGERMVAENVWRALKPLLR